MSKIDYNINDWFSIFDDSCKTEQQLLSGCDDRLILFGRFDQTRANSVTGHHAGFYLYPGGIICEGR